MKDTKGIVEKDLSMPRHLFRKENSTFPQFATTMRSAQARRIIAMINAIVVIGLDLLGK